jgi:hypothetical protein
LTKAFALRKRREKYPLKPRSARPSVKFSLFFSKSGEALGGGYSKGFAIMK